MGKLGPRGWHLHKAGDPGLYKKLSREQASKQFPTVVSLSVPTLTSYSDFPQTVILSSLSDSWL